MSKYFMQHVRIKYLVFAGLLIAISMSDLSRYCRHQISQLRFGDNIQKI